MNVFEFAMKMEKDGEQYYRELAKKAPSKNISNLMIMLANAESRHYNIFKAMKDGTPEPVNINLGDIPSLKNTKNIFEQLADENITFDLDSPEIEFYKKALEIEQKTRDFYLEKSDELISTPQKKMLRQIADEEQQHYLLIEELISNLSK